MGPCQKNKISLYFQFQLAPINLFPEKWGRQGKYMSCSPLCWYSFFFFIVRLAFCILHCRIQRLNAVEYSQLRACMSYLKIHFLIGLLVA